MLGFKRKGSKAQDDVPSSIEGLREEIERLSAATRDHRDRDAERRLLRLRHLAGIRLLETDGAAPDFPAVNEAALPQADGLPEISAKDLTPELLRTGILRDGCVLVRGLVDREQALAFAAQIDRAFAERDKLKEGGRAAEGYYEEFSPEPPFEPIIARQWIREGGGILAADSPMLSFEMLEMFRAAGLPEKVGDYLGEAPLLSAHKTTLRKASPDVSGAWHQDGKFLGEVRALNLWLSLSRCGDEAPGLDIIPRRLDHVVLDRGDDAVLDYVITQEKAEEIAASVDSTIIRPIFEPGDALFFDELFLHQTASDPSMPNPRYAIESWFFGGSAFPADYAPVAV
jgi:hypothetical protein